MTITGKCQDCKKAKAAVAFQASVQVGGETKYATAAGKRLRKLCGDCFGKALNRFVALSAEARA